jgi:hypothetical protein
MSNKTPVYLDFLLALAVHKISFANFNTFNTVITKGQFIRVGLLRTLERFSVRTVAARPCALLPLNRSIQSSKIFETIWIKCEILSLQRT